MSPVALEPETEEEKQCHGTGTFSVQGASQMVLPPEGG